MGMMKNVLAFLLLSTLQLVSLDRVEKTADFQKNYRPDRKWVARHYISPNTIYTHKKWKDLDKETAFMKALKSNKLESEAEVADILAKEENRGKDQENLPQGAATYNVLQLEMPRARRSPELNATFDDSNGRAEVGKSRPNLRYIVDARNAEGLTPLYLAVTNGHTDIAASFLQAGADLQQTFFIEDRNLLHEAARLGVVNSIRWLVKAGLSINATDIDKWTPLHYAANSGKLNATKTLIELKCCIDCKSSEGYTALRNAVVKDHTTIATQLVESGADVLQTFYDNHRTLLHEASRFDAVNSIHWLLNKGLSINVTDNEKWTPLHYAALNGNLNATKTLIELKCCIECKSSEGYTALRIAVVMDHTTIATQLVESGADVLQTSYDNHRTLLHEASRYDAVNSIRWLLNKGLNINATDNEKWTPLHYAALNGKLNATKTLIELKCCIECKSSEGYTALRIAVVMDHTTIATQLVESGADVLQTFYDNHRTLLHEASRFNAVNSIRWLLNKGLSINVTDNKKWTPLHLAALNGHLNAMKTLIELKCCIDCKSLDGHTALRNAVVKDHTTIATQLIESGADVLQTSYDDHRTLLHEATRFDAVNSIRWLLNKGLNINATDNEKWTLLHYAATSGKLNATKTLIELKCCIDCKSSEGFTALRNALVMDHIEIATQLIESGADVLQTFNDDHRTLLHEASRYDAVNSIRWLLKKGISINATDNENWTPLHYAANSGKLNATKILIELNCCIDCKSSKGHTALQNAVMKDHVTIAALLVDSGADVRQTFYDDHRTLLHVAAGYDAVNSIHWMVKKGLSVHAVDDTKWLPLHYAAYSGKLSATKTLIDLKSCINCKSAQGNTPLDFAEIQQHQDIAAFLKLNGATNN